MTRVDIRQPGQVIRDKDGIPHIFAESELDLVFLQGYVHARDRLFQMDFLRRNGEGTVAELVGFAAIGSDRTLRTFGVRRAAERTLPQLSRDTRAALAAYARGVNAYVATHALPPEYAALELASFRPWTEVDTVTVGKLLAFQLAFDIGDITQSMALGKAMQAGASNGFDGEALFFADLVRVAPFEQTSTIPDSLQRPRPPRPSHHGRSERAQRTIDDAVLRIGQRVLDQLNAEPYARDAIKPRDSERGSNAFVVSGRFSRTGEPLLAGDPHLQLTTPSQFLEVQLEAPSAGIDVIGMSLPGVPYVVFGNNNKIMWSGTNNELDVTDIYNERIVADPASPSGLSTIYRGAREHVIPLPQQFRYNKHDDGVRDNFVDEPPGRVLIVPRRNQGPLFGFREGDTTALSIQYVGNTPTREIEFFRRLARARGISDFARAVEDLDVGSQNFMCADTDGNIGYFMSGEVPLREDLQAGRIEGLSPMFIRNGQGGNEWIPARTNDASRSLPFEIVPASEMPRVINPPRGFIVTANNDPTGAMLDNDAFNQRRANGGILYLGAMFSDGVRASRIDELLSDKIRRDGRLDAADLKAIQSDTVMGEARVFTPSILQAFANARRRGAHATLARLAADPRIIEAVGRLAAWDQSTPTGIRQGYDANDRPGRLNNPSNTEIRHSVAATIYSVWRNQFLTKVIADTLRPFDITVFNSGRRELLTSVRNLLESFDENHGVGESGLDFFKVPGVSDAATRRDLIILESLAMALDKLAGSYYVDAFHNSTRQDDYRWGILHRVVLAHPLSGVFNTPSAGGAFPSPLGPRLPGLPIDGGLLTVDVANTVLLQDSIAAFTVVTGPVRRYVGQVRKRGNGIESEVSFPGGASGVLGNPFSLNTLERWLTNEMIPLRQGRGELFGNAAESDLFLPRRSSHRSAFELDASALSERE